MTEVGILTNVLQISLYNLFSYIVLKTKRSGKEDRTSLSSCAQTGFGFCLFQWEFTYHCYNLQTTMPLIIPKKITKHMQALIIKTMFYFMILVQVNGTEEIPF